MGAKRTPLTALAGHRRTIGRQGQSNDTDSSPQINLRAVEAVEAHRLERRIRLSGTLVHKAETGTAESFEPNHLLSTLKVDERIAAAVKKLKERGLVSPYLRSFVVARINPLRWMKGELPLLAEVLRLCGNELASSMSKRLGQKQMDRRRGA
jgi:hypothetical protein